MATATTHDGELIGWIELVVTQCVDWRFDGDNLIRVRQVSDRKPRGCFVSESRAQRRNKPKRRLDPISQ